MELTDSQIELLEKHNWSVDYFFDGPAGFLLTHFEGSVIHNSHVALASLLEELLHEDVVTVLSDAEEEERDSVATPSLTNLEILTHFDYVMECESPLEISFPDSDEFVSGWGAVSLINGLRDQLKNTII